MSSYLKLEEVYCLPESLLARILASGNQQSRDFWTDRYVAIVLLANQNRIAPEDLKYVSNPNFQSLYFDESALMTAGSEYISRFTRIKRILDAEAQLVSAVQQMDIQ